MPPSNGRFRDSTYYSHPFRSLERSWSFMFNSYGQRGFGIIQQLLYSMFPPDEYADEPYLPLTSLDFIQMVLTPETALRLIMEDQGCDEEKGIDTLRESASYGWQMFPELEDGEDEVREAIVEKRAHRRRREIALEEEEEAGNDVIQVIGETQADSDDLEPATPPLPTPTSSETSGSRPH